MAASDRTELAHLLQSTDSGNAVTFTEHWLLDEDLQEALRKYDVDNSGDLDLEEFTQLVYDGLLLDGKLSEYEEAFKRVDTSGNGSIGFMELSSLLTALGSPLSHEKLVDLFKQYDIDESGQIEFGEFLRMCRDQLLDLQKILSFMNDRPLPLEEQRMLVPAEGEISVILSEHELDEVLQRQQQQHRNDLVVVFCGFTWCRPCKAMAGPAGKLAQLYKKGTTWLKVYGNANSQTKNMCQHRLLIRSTPCFLLFKNGELVDTITGSNKQKLEGRIIHHLPEKYLPADGPLYYRPPAEAAASDVAMPAPA